MSLSIGANDSSPSVSQVTNNFNQSTSPATPFKSVQFNDSGAFGGNAGFLFDKTTLHFSLSAGTIDQTASIFGLGNSSAREIMNVRETVTTVSPNVHFGLYLNPIYNPSSTNTGARIYGIGVSAEMSSGNSKNINEIYGIRADGIHNGTGTVTTLYGVYGNATVASGATTTNAYAGYFESQFSGNVPTIKRTVGIVDLNSTLGSLTSKCGLFIGAHDPGTNTANAGPTFVIFTRPSEKSRTFFTGSLVSHSGPVLIGLQAPTQSRALLDIDNGSSSGATITGTGTVSSSGTTVTGSGTTFTVEFYGGDTLGQGDVIEASGQYRIVTNVASNTSLTTQTAFSPALSAGTTFKVHRASCLMSTGSNVAPQLVVIPLNTSPRVGIGTYTPTVELDVNGTIKAGTFTLTGFTAGSVLFSDGTNITQNNAKFFWDNSNLRFGILTAAPSDTFSIAEKTILNSSGVATKYNGITTVGSGIPSEYATVDLTAQGAAITATTLYAVPASGAGMYRISWVATVTQAATNSSVLGGTNGFQVVYTDKDDSVVKTIPGTIVSGVESNATNSTATGTISGCYVVSAKASTNIQYQIDYTSVGVTPMQFNLHIKLESL